MSKDEIVDRYFEWICKLIQGVEYTKGYSYHKLLVRLFYTDFNYTVAMDANREEDGIDLRYRFAREELYSQSQAAYCLDDRPCSVLEMMVALSLRCEEHIMDDPDKGNRTGQWFWGMIDSLGLRAMYDENYIENYVNRKICNFLNRRYQKNGKGGLFTLKENHKDMRCAEIWYQMCWYLAEMDFYERRETQ